MTKQQGYPIVLTADRTLMSEYGGGIFLGFSACVPSGLIPDAVYYNMFCPPIEVNPDGSVPVAPCGTRKVEAALLDSGFSADDVVVAHPEHLEKVVGPSTKVLGITENDPLGIGPATSTFNQILGGVPHMRIKFKEVLEDPAVKRYMPRIIVGGPGAWQLTETKTRSDLGIDCVVVGEAERAAPELMRKALRGEPLPGLVMGEPIPVDQVAKIRHATVDGLVEIARGCGRGCEFCLPTMQKYRCLDMEHILHDVQVNVQAGRQPILHAEDVVRYGAKGIEVNEAALIDLFRQVKEAPGVTRVSLSHFALASVASAPSAIREISRMLELDDRHWLAGQTGIETASPALMARYMRGKCKPFEPDEWPETVERSFRLLEENHWLPCGTLIMGLPGERDEDVEDTIGLMDRLSHYRSLVVPLFFVAAAELDEGSSFDFGHMSKAHTELFLRAWEHNMRWAPNIMRDWADRSVRMRAMRPLMRLALALGMSEVKELTRMCREDYDCDMGRMMRARKQGELSMVPVTSRAVLAMVRDSPKEMLERKDGRVRSKSHASRRSF